MMERCACLYHQTYMCTVAVARLEGTSKNRTVEQGSNAADIHFTIMYVSPQKPRELKSELDERRRAGGFHEAA